MAKTREQKEELVNDYKEQIAKSSAILFAEPNSITANEINEVREKIGDENGAVMIIKNRIFKLAMADSNVTMPEENEKGMNVVVFVYSDPVNGAKVLFELAKDEKFTLRYSILDGSKIEPGEVKQLASLPSVETLLTQVLYGFNAPANGFVNVLSGNIRGLLNVLNAVAEKA
ncbi:50S ribosomal protein L10 [Candidatus Dojkabacteria bacterium]|uniref:Large ribosomal subunit protein uL10 n=1 Tax=Candidatus Dojkabacteria bacterium TaxID=2099670 RepID=A0A955L3N0_9BACT|nr:50S ribosomal protein L10 [Candidatus Dojkabacteria bacterium]